MHEVAAFLRGHPPFDLATDEELEAVADAVEIEFHPAGEVLIAAGAPPLEYAHVVRRGALELVEGDRVLDVLGEGELAGHPSMLSGEPAGTTVRAAEDTLTYRVPAEQLAPLLARPGGLRWVARSLGRRVGRDSERPIFEPTGRPAGQLARPALLVAPTTTVGEAARRMADEGASCALVDLGTGLGILTDRDFRERVLAAGRGPDTVVAEVMTAPARAVAGDRASEDVLLELLDLGVRHAPVVDTDGRLIGVVSDLELLAGGPMAPFAARRAIERAADRDGLLAAASRVRETVVALHAARVDAVRVGDVLAALFDALVRRLIELAEADLGRPPVPWGWYALGSHGRRELALSSDSDSALAWQGDDRDPELRAYFTALATRVIDDVEAAGIQTDVNGARADRPLFARSVDAWAAGLRELPRVPDPEAKALILLSVILDGRAVTALDPASAAFGEALARSRRRSRRSSGDWPRWRCSTARRRASCATSSSSTPGSTPARSTSSGAASCPSSTSRARSHSAADSDPSRPSPACGPPATPGRWTPATPRC